ncbi:ABC transporter ATP-binding protein [Paenibacillus abyssi]|uniref:Sugar ABC transporter ATP-binding protein n=1 Tax=Paenibacillus abyssi TaxID=1340531 RepID=A0A917CPM8_9BACL|nr:ABC transporter ATP-binding protein [Paenibacillus abyssi]GGF93525.1 sugar ABC transporter ATP-binding protein [Paenibacillus abyssi]
MAEIRFEGVDKHYGKVEAIKNLNFVCEDKDFFAILGPSGCGKSSTLRMLAGLEDITSGSLYIGGRRVNDVKPSERNVAMSFENFGLYPHFTVYENLAYPLTVKKMNKADIREKVLVIAQEMQLTSILNYMPGSLSNGQKQRVSIARALVRNPDVTIMDEPLSHLDAELRGYMRHKIKHTHRALGLTTVYVTHDQVEAMTMADKILIMNHGVIQQLGTPDEVYFNPANEFVAGFIGTPQMNFIACSIQSEGTAVSLINPYGLKVVLSDEQKHMLGGHAGPVKLGVRPHNIQMFTEKTSGRLMTGEVYIVEPLGETNIITIKVGDIQIKAETEPSFKPKLNDTVYFDISSDKCHLFDGNTGKAFF